MRRDLRDRQGQRPRAASTTASGEIAIETDRGTISAPLVVDALGWRRMLAGGDGYQPPDAPLSRGLEVHPDGGAEDLEIWIDRRYVPGRLRLVASRPATRPGSASAPSTPASTSARRPSCWPRTSSATASATRATGSPTNCAAATEGGVFFAGDSAGHCLPLTAEGIRTALYFGIALGRELRGVIEGRQTREQAAAAYAEFNDSHEWKFEWMLRVQKLVPRVPPRLLGPLIKLMGSKRFINWSFSHYLNIAPPEFAGSAHDQDHPAQQQPDPEQPLGTERDLVEAE